MHAGEQATARPLDRGRVVAGVDGPLAEAALDGEALGLEDGEADGDPAGRQAGALDQVGVRSAATPPRGGRGAAWAAACSAVVPSTSTPSTSARTAGVASTVCHRTDAVVAGERRHPAAGVEGVEQLGPLRRARG